MFKVGNLAFVDASDLPPMVERVRRWDVASSNGKGDYTVGALVGKDAGGRFYVLDVVRGQLGTDDRNNVMVQTAQQDGTGVRIVVPQDPGSAGKDQSLAFTRLLSGYNVKAVRETGSKETRADGFASQVNAGNVAVVRANWNNAWAEEHRQFPMGAHDDQVDATAGAFNELANVSNVWDW
jgi:predicted phage terminase large subunit-like protein